MAYANAGDLYRQQSAMTASPGELTLMLFDGCIKNLKLAKIHINGKDYAKTNETLQKAQAIIAELIHSLDMRYDIAKQLIQLYTFILDTVVQANVKKDLQKTDDALGLMEDLRGTWKQAIRINRAKQSGSEFA
ncbi:MAG: flagellar export chaperone FliS [Oscillospiraceae bacterium]|nr:flagellar export chaperone FliS [Oscillospiraceae bacterium]